MRRLCVALLCSYWKQDSEDVADASCGGDSRTCCLAMTWGLMLFCHHLEIPNNFGPRACVFIGGPQVGCCFWWAHLRLALAWRSAEVCSYIGGHMVLEGVEPRGKV